jgi:uncharacterized protein (TIGR00106 family)
VTESSGALTVLVAFSISPMGSRHGGGDQASVSQAVAACVRLVRESGLPNETNAMFTNVEGPYDEVMALVRRCIELLARDAPRVSLVLKLDHRPGHEGMLRTKAERVEKLLAESAAQAVQGRSSGGEGTQHGPS